MAVVEISGLREFLRSYPKMAIRPSSGADLRLKGSFDFAAHHAKGGDIQDSFTLEIIVPSGFPRELPRVTETGGRIPRTGEYHINPTDNTLCLGSPLSLLIELSKKPTLEGFAENCLVPYLFGISHKQRTGDSLPFGELDHGVNGLFADYLQLFGLQTREQLIYAFRLLGMKKRRANKHPCPCGCGTRLGRCKFNLCLGEFRKIASRTWFRRQIGLNKGGKTSPT